MYAVNEQDPGVKLQVRIMHFSPSHCLLFSSTRACEVRSCKISYIISVTQSSWHTRNQFNNERSKRPVVIAGEAHLVACASIPRAPNHLGSRAQEVLTGGALVDGSPTGVAWQYSGFPSPEDCLEDLRHTSNLQFESANLLCI